MVQKKNPSYNKINYCSINHPIGGFSLKGGFIVTIQLCAWPGAFLEPALCDNLEGSKKVYPPRSHRTLVFLERLLGGPQSKYLSRNFLNCYFLHPVLVFHKEYQQTKGPEWSCNQEPITFVHSTGSQIYLTQFTFYIRYNLGNGAPDIIMANFVIPIRLTKSKLVIIYEQR